MYILYQCRVMSSLELITRSHAHGFWKYRMEMNKKCQITQEDFRSIYCLILQVQ